MFEDLNQRLGWNSLFAPPENGLLLITSEGTDGGFLIHHFVSFFLKHKLPVCLVTVAQTFSHYAQASGRIGANLDQAKAEGMVSHIDLMSSFTQNYLGIDETKRSSSNCQWSARHIFLRIKSEVERITLKLKASTGSEQALVVVDDTSLLCGLGLPLTEVKDLVHYLTVFSKSSNSLFVTVVPTFIDEVCDSLQRCAIHSADVVLQVRSLPSGYSKDVHGHLQLWKRHGANSTWQYKLTDKNLCLFAKGTSSAVL